MRRDLVCRVFDSGVTHVCALAASRGYARVDMNREDIGMRGCWYAIVVGGDEVWSSLRDGAASR